MKYIIRKYVTAKDAESALKLDKDTPVHDLYLKDGQEPDDDKVTNAIGFATVNPFEDE